MYEFVYYQARDVMTQQPITVDPYVTLSDVEALFEKYDFNGLPVTDETHRLIGMITKLDLLKAIGFTKRISDLHHDTITRQQVSQMITQEVQVFDPDASLISVLYKMIETGNKSFPVVENYRARRYPTSLTAFYTHRAPSQYGFD